MTELVIHIGYSKCASSSLQGFLTANSELSTSRGIYRYITFDAKDRIIPRDLLTNISKSPPRYAATDLSEDNEKLKRRLGSINKPGSNYNYIISNEGFANAGWLTADRFKIFSSLGIPIRIFMLIRPFPDWLNASWWQWGCWTGASVDGWLNQFRASDYLKGLEQWLRLPNVTGFQVSDISENPIETFASFIGHTGEMPNLRNNAASSSDLIRFILKNKEVLGRSIHSPLIEFQLNEELNFKGQKPPYVVSKERIKRSLDEFSTETAQILDWMKSGKPNQDEDSRRRHLSVESFSEEGNLFNFNQFLSEPYSYEFLEEISKLMAKKMRVPRGFDPFRYLSLHRDVEAAGVDPYQHYITYGEKEGRRI